MREFINIVTENRRDHHEYIRGVFYHGTARQNLDFHESPRVSYFTQDMAVAREYAEGDAMDEGDIPVVIKARLDLHNPAVLDMIEMQDLHFMPQRVAELVAQGHDCAVYDHEAGDEVAVFGSAPIKIIEIIKVDQ